MSPSPFPTTINDDTSSSASSFHHDSEVSPKTLVPIEMEDVSASLPSVEEIRGDIAYVSKKNRHVQWLKRGSMFFVLFLVLIVVISASVGLSKRGVSAPRAASPASVVDFLAESGISTSNDLSNEGTPQERAARWLAESDPANIPVPVESSPEHEKYRYLVRYVQLYSLTILDNASHIEC